ncbi:hypothetical protein INT48_001462 [Thamnidium elegans]|uniref:Uncharacterized protein n=1 Tax=Thamnidium elegans TaxID=101142 RepID=A0A8H7VQF0_9FUNG|nr:hypothetical protein INT48_001462 [Thamnidium elegans]
MSSQFTDPELLLFTMDPKYSPGSDLIAKIALRNLDIVNIVVTTVIDEEARSLYSPRPTEWPNGTKFDVMYVSSVNSPNLPPVLIEVQHTTTKDLIDLLIGYPLCIKKEYKVKPIIVVFGTHVIRNDVSSDFEATSFSYIKQIQSKYWADKCYFVDKNTITQATEAAILPPMMEQTLNKVSADKSTSEVLIEVCNQTNLQFKKILNTLDPMPETILKKRLRAYADGGGIYTQTHKQMYRRSSDVSVEPMPPPPELSELAENCTMDQINTSIGILHSEITATTDMEYVHLFQQTAEGTQKTDWNLCFESGILEGFF